MINETITSIRMDAMPDNYWYDLSRHKCPECGGAVDESDTKEGMFECQECDWHDEV